MDHVEAIYRHGVFEPLGPVPLAEEQRVRLRLEPLNATHALTWLTEVAAIQARIVERQGRLPDSSSEIAADRLR
jgi:predicted DNA-binding antitoxin AbrB/MazE fold protein